MNANEIYPFIVDLVDTCCRLKEDEYMRQFVEEYIMTYVCLLPYFVESSPPSW